MSFCHPPVSLSIYLPFCAFAIDVPPMSSMSSMYAHLTKAYRKQLCFASSLYFSAAVMTGSLDGSPRRFVML
jgi:hypothetical protein